MTDEPKRVRHIIDRVRHEGTARALYAYLRERFDGVPFEYEYNANWWLMMAVSHDDELPMRDADAMIEACRGFVAGRKSMVD